MSTSNTVSAASFTFPVASFQYPQTIQATPEAPEPAAEKEPEITLTEKHFAQRLAAERAAGYAEADGKLRQEVEQRTERQAARITQRLAEFEQMQKQYFARVEAEVVQLALAIAGKILHREAQVDPMLLAAIVHLALGQLKEGSAASVRVRPEQAQRWHAHLAAQSLDIAVKVVEDADLEQGDCILDTELGTVNFSLDAQLKEVERGFFDLLAQKPQI
jgi:flagellar assembly protein FliH